MNDDLLSRLLLAIHGIADEDLRKPEGNAKWSIFDVIAHLGDYELLTQWRLRGVEAAFDGNAFVAMHRGERLADVLEQLSFFRRMNLGRHTERAHNHQEKHLGQIERIKRTLGLAASEQPQNAHEVGREGGARTFGEVRVHDLWQNGVKRALRVEFPAGAQWPGLDHHLPGPEEVYVLSGELEDGGTTYGAGTFLHYPAGSSHSPRSAEGCTLFVFYPEG